MCVFVSVRVWGGEEGGGAIKRGGGGGGASAPNAPPMRTPLVPYHVRFLWHNCPEIL